MTYIKVNYRVMYKSITSSGTIRDIRVEELPAADALWLTSSVRLAAPITALDGVPHAVDDALTAAVNAYLIARTD